jgi:lipoyl(octanoyl) transferase
LTAAIRSATPPAALASRASLPTDWRLLRTAPAEGGWNMACDLTLLELARATQIGYIRVYGWSRPTVSFGRNERIVGAISPEMLAASGLDAIRRPTGGRALLHHREVTYSVAIPLIDELRWHHAYAAINELLRLALVNLGVPARISGTSESAVPRYPNAVSTTDVAGPVCFSGIAAGELAVQDRKLVASSVWRERGAYLQHGSIPIVDDQALLTSAFGKTLMPPEPAAVLPDWIAGLSSVTDASDVVEAALNTSVAQCGNARQWSIPDVMVPAIEAKRAQLVASDWLWRR